MEPKNNAKEFTLLLGSLENIRGAVCLSAHRFEMKKEAGPRCVKSRSGNKENDMVELEHQRLSWQAEGDRTHRQ